MREANTTPENRTQHRACDFVLKAQLSQGTERCSERLACQVAKRHLANSVKAQSSNPKNNMA